MTTHDTSPANGVARTRAAMIAAVAVLVAVDLGLKGWAGRALADGHTADLGLLQLRLRFNSGVAFSLGAELPAGVLLGIIGLVIAALAVVAWRATRTATLPTLLAMSALLAGAVANLVDRAADGTVTDYLHTGWFPTFNLADVLITGGAIGLILANLTPTSEPETRPSSRP